MGTNFDNKTCIILMATHDDWRSVAHIIPILDEKLSGLGLRGHVVIVDDASDDVRGREIIPTLKLSAIENIDEVQLASNQGNQRAVAIGVAYVAKNLSYDYLVVMDSDNEDKPDDVPALLRACLENNDSKIIFAERSKRSERKTFKLGYFIYKKLFRLISGKSISVGNFCVIPGPFVKRIAHISELWNHFPISIIRSGLPHDGIPTERGTRLFGQGKMNLVKLIVHAFSGFSIHADVIAVRVLLFASLLGALFIFVVAVIVATWFGTDLLIPGWASQILMQFFLLFTLVLCTTAIILVLALSLRMLPNMIPYYDHMRFVFEINRIFPDKEKI